MTDFRAPFIDAHAHANLFTCSQWADVVGRALAKNVRACLSAGVWWSEFRPFLDSHKAWIADRCLFRDEFSFLFSEPEKFWVFPCIGIHPMEVALRWRDLGGFFDVSAARREVDSFINCARQYSHFIWAIGETGFDCAKSVLMNWSSKQELLKAQDFAFEASLSLALELNRPLVVHSRSAWQQTRKRLDEAHTRGLKSFMLHCYSGHATDLQWLESRGGFAGFGGVLTWPQAQKMKNSVKAASDRVLLLETDSPDLAPILFDGVRPPINEPGFLFEIATVVAELRQQEISSLCEKNFNNLRRFLLE